MNQEFAIYFIMTDSPVALKFHSKYATKDLALEALNSDEFTGTVTTILEYYSTGKAKTTLLPGQK